MNERNTKDGETHWAQASGKGLQRPAPKQFSEIDESASSQSADSESMKAIGDLAYRDATTGVDTDRGPVMDAVYNGAVTEGHRIGGAEKSEGPRKPAKAKPPRQP